MANLEQDYINALQNFSKSVELLVDAIKLQVEQQGKSPDLSEAVGNSKDQAEKLSKIAKQVHVISENVNTTKNNTDEILEIVKGIKKEKKQGIWDRLDSAKDKNKSTAEGIKTIALMAGAILAVGMAFKIVGEVDFSSVLALSIALPLVATAFNKVGETIDNPKDAAMIALSMVVMSAGVAVSSWFLALVPELTFKQMFSAIGTSITLGIAMYAVAAAADEIGISKIRSLYGIVPIMPLVAAGIAASAYIIQNMPEISFGKMLTTVGVGIAIGASMIPLAYAARVLNPKDFSSLGLMLSIMPGVAASIFASAFIMQYMPEVGVEQMLTTAGVGLALGLTMIPLVMAGKFFKPKDFTDLALMLAIMPGVAASIYASAFIMQNMPDVGIEQMATTAGVGLTLGIAMIPLVMASKYFQPKDFTSLALMLAILPGVAAGIYASAYILQDVPEVDLLTTLNTSLAVAGSTLAVAGAIALMAKMKLSTKDVLMGTISMAIISAGLMATSHILALGNYENYPDVDWASGVSLAMLGALPSVLVLGLLGATGVGFLVIGAGIAGMLMVAGGLVAVADILNGGDFTGGPTAEWSTGVGIALMTFANTLTMLSPGLLGMLMGDTLQQRIDMIPMLGEALKMTSESIQGGNYTGGPSKEWSQGVGIALMTFANTLDALEPGVLDMFMGDTLLQRINMIPLLGIALKNTSFAIQGGNYTGGPSKAWAQGVGISLTSFAKAMKDLDDDDSLWERIKLIPHLGVALRETSFKIQGGDYDTKKAPSKAWAEGVGGSLVKFAKAMKDLGEEGTLWERIKLIPHLGVAISKVSLQVRKGKYDNFPSKDWSSGVGTALLNFAKVMKNMGEEGTLWERIKLMPHLGAGLRDVSLRVSKGNYTNYPSKDWAQGTSLALAAVAKTIIDLSKKLSPEEIDEWVPKVKLLGNVISHLGWHLNTTPFDNYPSADWSKGVLSFMKGFSSIKGLENVSKSTKGIKELAKAYSFLAWSLNSLSKSIKGLKKIPNMKNIYGGLVTLSLIDNKNLTKVMDTLKTKEKSFDSLLSIIGKRTEDKSQGNQNKDGVKNPVTGEKPKVDPKTQGQGKDGVKVTTTPKTPTQPKIDRSEQLLSQLTTLQQEMNKLLGEIADNTSNGNLKPTNVSHG